MRISVVISTYNRAQSLRTTLDALRHQRHRDFEVVVVDGPSDDGTKELLAERSGALRIVACPERMIAVSRNLGVDAAAGEVVAMIDDDAVPEPRWLADLAAAYENDRVGGAGGRVLDGSGVRIQYRYAVSDRVGRTDFDAQPPFGDAASRPGADPFVYFQGTNLSFRRDALEAVGGFDEHLGNYYDDVEVCARVLDAGFELRALEGAVVHHGKLPSYVRDAHGLTDPFRLMRDRAYIALRLAAGHRSRGEALGAASAELERYRAHLASEVRHGHRGEASAARVVSRAEDGFAEGIELGLAGERGGRPIASADPDAFLPYPALPAGEAVCFLAPDATARELASAGNEVHVLAPGDEYRILFEDGVWVHHVPAGAPLRGAYDRAAARFAFDRVVGAVPAEPVDPARFPHDVETEVLRALRHDDPQTIVAAVYAALLRRPATAEEMPHGVARLLADERLFVREVATSDEARRLEHDLGFLERLPERTYAEQQRELRREERRTRFLEGEQEILVALQGAPDATFVDTVYRLLLEREPDASADDLRVLERAAVVWAVGTSAEARESGVPPEAVQRLMRGLAERRVVRWRRR